MEFKNRRKGYEWHHQRLEICESAFTQNGEMGKHISGDVGLMTSDKDSQSPIRSSLLFELHVCSHQK